MGYYTQYNLDIYKIIGPKPSLFPFKDLERTRASEHCGLEDIICQYLEKYSYDCGSEFGGEFKWYYHDEDMRRISGQFPNLLFFLSGDGEASGDIWNKYYINGKVQFCPVEFVFPEFNSDYFSDVLTLHDIISVNSEDLLDLIEGSDV